MVRFEGDRIGKTARRGRFVVFNLCSDQFAVHLSPNRSLANRGRTHGSVLSAFTLIVLHNGWYSQRRRDIEAGVLRPFNRRI